MQHPKITVSWAIASLERARDNLGDGHAETRVLKQFHQLLLALERDGHTCVDQRLFTPTPSPAKVIYMPVRNQSQARVG